MRLGSYQGDAGALVGKTFLAELQEYIMPDLLVSTFRLLRDLHSIATKLFQVDTT
jgi:hypothetical protein